MPELIKLPPKSKYVMWFAIAFPLIMTFTMITLFILRVGDKPRSLIGLVTVLSITYAVHLLIFIPVFRRCRLETSHQGLSIYVGWYCDTIKWSQIDWSASGPLDVQQQTPKKARWRTNGIGIPGYKAGWFNLKDGRSAFLAITDTHLPQLLLVTTDHDIILSFENPNQRWQQLQKYR